MAGEITPKMHGANNANLTSATNLSLHIGNFSGGVGALSNTYWSGSETWTDPVPYLNLVNSEYTFAGTTSGTNNAITLTYFTGGLYTFPAYQNGQTYSFSAALGNTGSTTINVNGNGVVSIFDVNGNALKSGAIVSGNIYFISYSTNLSGFILNNPSLVPLTTGGTNASLTASNGGIFYSTASAGAILAGTATANQVLLSGSSTTPAWSTATYPATTTNKQLLYSSATNTISGLATANSSVLVTDGSGNPSLSTTLPSSLALGTPASGTLTNCTGLPLAGGGTNANLSASTGAIVYSTSTAMAFSTTVSQDSNGNFGTSAGMSDTSTSFQIPTTGFSITIGNNTQRLVLNPAGTLATGTITMPASPANGCLVVVSSTKIVTALTVSANGGQSILAAPSTIAAGGAFSFIYRTSNTTWYPTG